MIDCFFYRQKKGARICPRSICDMTCQVWYCNEEHFQNLYFFHVTFFLGFARHWSSCTHWAWTCIRFQKIVPGLCWAFPNLWLICGQTQKTREKFTGKILRYALRKFFEQKKENSNIYYIMLHVFMFNITDFSHRNRVAEANVMKNIKWITVKFRTSCKFWVDWSVHARTLAQTCMHNPFLIKGVIWEFGHQLRKWRCFKSNVTTKILKVL